MRRYLADLLAAELAQARPGRVSRAGPWPADLDLVRDLGADSLELLGMASAMADALHLRAAEADRDLLARPRLSDWIEAARAGLDADASQLSFRTSGSGGSPKRCTHTLSTLWQEVHELARLLPGRRRILSAVPSHHIYGFLFTVLLPRLLGIDEVIDLRSAGPSAVLTQVRAGDLVVAHPAWWDALLRTGPRFDAGIAGVSSGAPCADALATGLADAGLRLLQMYGSSETAGVGWREHAGVPFALLPYWRRADDAHVLARTLPDGASARYPLQDRLDWQDARRFLPAGRIDQAVQVGGVNVFPAYVAEVLRMHPRVRDASVRLMRADEGQRLKAFVVPDAWPLEDGDKDKDDGGGKDEAVGEDALREALAAWVAARLRTAECPAAWTFGAHLPRQASGKPADWIIDAG